MPRGRPSPNFSQDQTEDFQRQLRAWMAEQGLDARRLAGQIGYSKEYVRLLLGEYREKDRPPSVEALARLREAGFDWQPPRRKGGKSTAGASKEARRDGARPAGDGRKQRKRKAPLNLVERDGDIVLFLARADLATREQIQSLCFPSAATATRRLRALVQAGVLARYRPPAAAGGQLSGSAQYMYALGPKGAKLAGEILGRPVRRPFAGSKAPKTLFLEHRLEVTQFFVHLVQGAGDRLLDWATGAALEDRVCVGGRQQRFVPDGYLALRLDDGSTRHALVEVDRGTMGRRAWLFKARAYQAYYRSGAYNKRYATDRLLLLVVVPDAARRTLICQVMRSLRPVVMCFVAAWPDVAAHAAVGPAWLRYDTGVTCDLLTIPSRR
ncbi:MAG: replication-relaxation family protein [Anaerolineae bacterium]|nr:replication-relaxation family protein [Anaerolineae bacterium]